MSASITDDHACMTFATLKKVTKNRTKSSIAVKRHSTHTHAVLSGEHRSLRHSRRTSIRQRRNDAHDTFFMLPGLPATLEGTHWSSTQSSSIFCFVVSTKSQVSRVVTYQASFLPNHATPFGKNYQKNARHTSEEVTKKPTEDLQAFLET